MVKLADTLQAMADFPVAMASGINIVKEDDTEKDLQQMYEDGELGGESMPMPLSANMLLVSENDETSGDLIWSQIDKSEVGSVPLICTEQEWEDLDPKPVEGTEVIITDDEDGVNKELIDDDTINVDTTWSSNKINADLDEKVSNEVTQTTFITTNNKVFKQGKMCTASIINMNLTKTYNSGDLLGYIGDSSFYPKELVRGLIVQLNTGATSELRINNDGTITVGQAISLSAGYWVGSFTWVTN